MTDFGMARVVPRRRSRFARALDPVAGARAIGESSSLLRRQRHLLLALTRREITDPHERQLLGPLWAFIQPIMLMSVYALVFAFVFRLRISSHAGQLPLDYTAYLLAGLVPWLGFQSCLTRATSSVVGEANLVKQVQFPVELLPVRTAAACLVTQLVGVLYLVIYAGAKLGAVPATYALIPLLLATQLIAMAGAAFFISAVSVFFRDIRELIIVATLVGVYMLPIFYLPDVVPPAFHTVLKLNPFSYMVWCYQDAFYYGRIAHWYAWVIFGGGSLVVYSLGYRIFRHLKPYFGDVL